MSNKKDGGPAYPRTMWTGNDKNRSHRDVAGMTMRDYFATHSPFGINQALDILNGVGDHGPAKVDDIAQTMADLNYRYADAMLAEREK